MTSSNIVEVHDFWMTDTDASHDSGNDVGSDTGSGGPPVVFLHGNPTSSHLWRNVIPHAAGAARCPAFDLIGMGASANSTIGFRFGEHAYYLDSWFNALGLGDVVIVGHDLGVAPSMDWAARHPEPVRGVGHDDGVPATRPLGRLRAAGRRNVSGVPIRTGRGNGPRWLSPRDRLRK